MPKGKHKKKEPGATEHPACILKNTGYQEAFEALLLASNEYIDAVGSAKNDAARVQALSGLVEVTDLSNAMAYSKSVRDERRMAR